jgi:hypothetical protein
MTALHRMIREITRLLPAETRVAKQSSRFNDFVSLIEIRSYALVWVEHDSDSGSHGTGSDVSSESASDGSVMSMSADDLTPAASESGSVHGVLDLVNICNSFTHVPSGTLLVIAVFDVNESLVHDLSDSISSEAGENTLLVKSDWLSLVVLLPVSCFCLSFCHSSLFLIKIIQYIVQFISTPINNIYSDS